MTFENQQSGNGGIIILQNESKEIGRLTYTIFPEDQKLIISFVYIKPENEGKGFGKLLVEEAINFAREKHWKVYPHCSYSRAVMMRMQNIEDIFLK